ncbi:MAG: hypothetical protein JW854_02735 [Actinobacteria bacterium]|nr:hypothetical protein [Actinomycetota bacterium]
MQKKPDDSLFINSSYRRAGLLKTLLQGFRHGRETDETQEFPHEHCDGVLPPPRSWSGEKGGDPRIKKAASL